MLSLVTATPSLLSCHSLVIKYGAWPSYIQKCPWTLLDIGLHDIDLLISQTYAIRHSVNDVMHTG